MLTRLPLEGIIPDPDRYRIWEKRCGRNGLLLFLLQMKPYQEHDKQLF